MESRTASTNRNVEIILNDRKEWPYFIQLVRAQCLDLGIWDKANPDMDNPPAALTAPQMVTTEMAGAAPGTPLVALDQRQVTIYKMLQDDYKFRLDVYIRERTDLASTHKWVRDHITRQDFDVIGSSKSLHDTLKRLKARYQPTDEARRQPTDKATRLASKLDLKNQWRQLMNSEVKSQKPMKVLDKITNLHQRMVEESIWDDSDKTALIECLNLIGRINRMYAEVMMCSIHDPGHFIQTVPDLVNNFRATERTRPPQSRQKVAPYAYR